MPVDVSTLLRDRDPTLEIRRYIEQLQDAVRDACARQTVIEQERDRLADDVSRLRADAEVLRTECREARRDRDTVSEQAGQYGAMLNDAKQKAEGAERQRLDVTRQRDEAIRFYKDSQRQVEELMRIKDEAVKQRDAFARQRDGAKKEREELVERLGQVEAQLADARKVAAENNREEIQKQITALRQARDAATKQSAELKQRIGQLEDEIANISYDRDRALAGASKAAEESAAKSDAVKDEADELRKKVAALKRRNATLGEGVDSLTTEVQQLKAAQEQANEEREAAAAELRREMEKLARERETEMEEYGNKLGELRSAHENELQLARQQYEAAMNERDAARARAQEREGELDELRGQLTETKAVVERLASEAAERMQQIDVFQKDRLRAEAAEKVLDEARISLGDSQKQIEYIIRDRDTLREQMTAQVNAIEEKLKQQVAEHAELKRQIDQSNHKVRGHENLTREHEEHRLQIIELSAKLATAHGEIKELSAHLAEARLRVKEASKVDTSADAMDPTMKQSLTALRRVFQEYLRQPADSNLLNELQTHAQKLADRARETGQMIVQRVSSVLAALTRELFETPEQATPPTMRSLGQGIEFIATLARDSGVDSRVNLANLTAFAVDDDHSVLDVVCEALEAAGVSASITDSAGAALAGLAGSAYDLIILDVNLPELDGLELCSHVREMDLHKTTPVVFITGHASLENRVQFSLRGGSELMIKPFNLLELALRSLSLIIKHRMQAALAQG
jgi:CheY-like chemotaxis protein/chromosome segregation ATPase